MKIVNWWRNAVCRHRVVRVRASTGVEAAGDSGIGNATVGVTVRCARCDRVWTDDVVAAIQADALARLERVSKEKP